jgi:hypothetical protein
VVSKKLLAAYYAAKQVDEYLNLSFLTGLRVLAVWKMMVVRELLEAPLSYSLSAGYSEVDLKKADH